MAFLENGEGRIVMQAKRAVLSVLLILLACVACSPSHDAIERWAPNYKTENGELLYRLSVNNPSLSSDGRYMAFDLAMVVLINGFIQIIKQPQLPIHIRQAGRFGGTQGNKIHGWLRKTRR